MKKLTIILIMLVPVMLFAQVQPAASTIGLKGTPQNYQPSANRSVPPGIAIWSQPPVCEGSLWASQIENVMPFDAKVVDDFLFASAPGQITAARWWIGWFNGTYVAPESFTISIYADNNCLPGSLVTSWDIPFAASHEDAGCITSWDSREYWANLTPSFNPVPGQHYWITFQPVLVFPPQTGIPASATQNLCPAMQEFVAINLPMTDIDGTYDTAFELYAGSPVSTPVSSWMLLLSGVLIAGAIFFRYRRMS